MSWTDEVSPDHPEALANVGYDALRRVVFDVLHGATVIGPAPDPRRGIRPFELLSDLLRRADRVVRSRVTEILREFLYELVDTGVWPAEARWDLLDLVQDCGHGVVDDIRALVRQKTLCQAPDIGPAGHAGLVKCLLSLGALSTPEWWLEQFDLLGKDYGALIFSGLVEHGLDEAVNRLPLLCASDVAWQQLRLLIPGLVDRFGLERVRQVFATQLPRLSDAAAQAFAEDLSIAAAPPREEILPTPESYAAIITDEAVLAADGIAISDMDKMREASTAVIKGLVVASEIVQTHPPQARNWLVLGQTAKLLILLGTLVSGEHAPMFLWRVCEKLLLIFTDLRLTPDRGAVKRLADYASSIEAATVERLQRFLSDHSRAVSGRAGPIAPEEGWAQRKPR